MTSNEALAELPEGRREVVETVRRVILENLPAGYVDTVNCGRLSYEMPLGRYPQTHNGRVLPYVSLAARDHHYGLYLMGVYQDRRQGSALRKAFEKAGKKLDVGKCCLRFRRVEPLPPAEIGRLIAGAPPEAFIRRYDQARRER